MNKKTEDWGPFGRPIFNDPSARALSRVGVVDVGSNSVRLVVFDGAARSPAYFFNEKILCGLGAGFAETGRLNPEGRARALSAIKRFQLLAKGMRLPPLTAVATAAVREAEDGPDFCAEVLRETGLNLFVIDGEEEARLSAQGVLLGWPEAKGLVCDIGGSSMELAQIADGKVGKRVTSPLGPLKLAGVPGGENGLEQYIARIIDELALEMGTDHKRLFLVGGSWRAIARLDMLRREYPLTVLHEYRMQPASLEETLNWISGEDIEVLRQKIGISPARMALVPVATIVLKALMRRFIPQETAISAYGIREGMLFEQMPARLRKRDPLIEACRFAEQKDARNPGFGKALYEFILPLYKSARAPERRIIKAACLLHDVSWRAHPDFRHEVCFDNATRANLGGLTHEERVFLGLALLHRYKNSSAGSRYKPLFAILSDDEKLRAEVLGKAMRFGAMFAINNPAGKAELGWHPKKGELHLKIHKKARNLFGEVADARFLALAQAMQAQPFVHL
ncbi:MAG: Ppx/GppA family phosphatase [Rhodobacteraceae bacterium]|nr:Ppx/GppA family phosphatase [Paracoccaceae bacterium]